MHNDGEIQDEVLRSTTNEDLTAHPDAILMCDDHERDFQERLSQAPQGVKLKAFHVIASLAIKTVGSRYVSHVHCPVCALKSFDYIAQTAAILSPVN